MSQLRQHEQKLNDLDVILKIVTFDNDLMAIAYVEQTRPPWPLLLDTDQSLYAAYGMTRGSWWSIYGIGSIWKYLKLIFRGRMPGKPGKDWRQLGGDVLIDPTGIVRLHHVSADPHDRPTGESIFSKIVDRRID